MRETPLRIVVWTLMVAGPAGAWDRGSEGPPREAVQACASSSASASCSFTLGDRSVTGTCETPLGGSTLACRPSGPPPEHGHRGPPRQAVTACASLAANAACSFSMGDRSVTGTCETPPGGSALACRPSGPPPENGHRGPPREAVTACASLAADAACSFSMGDRSVTGTCETPPGGSTLACWPSGPPPGHHLPPEEAVKACVGLSANAACAFTHGSMNLTGTCVAPPGESTGSLACRPEHLPPPGT